MERSEMVDRGLDFDFDETIRLGDEYLWDGPVEYSWDEENEDCGLDSYWEENLEMGFNPY